MTEPRQTSQPKVIAAIPCFNTEASIADIVTKAKKYVDQVIVIDDGSHDGTAEIAKAAGALVIKHSINRGAGEAAKSCFEAARTNAADVLVTLDGDGQHNPDEIPQLLTPIRQGEADLVIGSRFLGDHSSMPKYRKFGINVITLLYNIGSKMKVSDAQGCFRAYSKKALASLNITESGFGFSVQLLIEARQRGFIIKEAPISCIYHEASHSANPVVHGLGVALSVVRIRFKNSLFAKTEKQ